MRDMIALNEQFRNITEEEIRQMTNWNSDIFTQTLISEPRKKIALITGICGQDGSYLAEFLLEKDYKVVGVYRRCSSPNFSRIAHIKDKIKLEEGDVSDYTSMRNIIHRFVPDEIYNLAAQSHVKTSFEQPFYTTQVDYIGCLNILEIVKWASWKPKFYQASTSEMFGSMFSYETNYCDSYYDQILHSNKTKDCEYCQGFQDENTPMVPNSPYAIAKLAAHNAVRLYRESYGVYACAGILFNHESERRGDEFVTKKISNYVKNLKYETDRLNEDNYQLIINSSAPKYKIDPNKYPKLKLGNLDAQRDWGYAPDYVEGMWLMLQQDKPDDFVLATGETHSVKEFLVEAFKEIGIEKWGDYVEFDQSFTRPCEVPYLRGNANKAKEVLGWEPKVKFPELVRRMVNG